MSLAFALSMPVCICKDAHLIVSCTAMLGAAVCMSFAAARLQPLLQLQLLMAHLLQDVILKSLHL